MGWVNLKLMTERNYQVMAELATQQNKDWMEAMVMATIQMALFMPKGEAKESINASEGIVETILSYEMGRFISLCLKGKREASFDSFLNWAFQFGRGIDEIHPSVWRKNTPKACRNLWKELPKNLKRGKKSTSEKAIIYSTKNRDCENAKSILEERLSFYKSRGLKSLAKKTALELSYIEGADPLYREAFIRCQYGI